MNPYPAPSTITMQRPGESAVNITLEDAVVIMTNQQKTIDELIRNNQKMYQYIQEMQSMGIGGGGVQFVQQNLNDPASHVAGTGAGAPAASGKPMTLSEYLASKNAKAAATPSPSLATPPTAANTPKPMTLSEYLASKNAAAAPAPAATEPALDTDSKLAPENYTFN
jgi:hypothetical protein